MHITGKIPLIYEGKQKCLFTHKVDDSNGILSKGAFDLKEFCI
ncbi:hypothetical protein SAMN02982927_01260 [Sporolactobacillus nakayamae]|uniref:Uncharacterized protein n=1 Tax=Sporolactobacillus nakayamae TaxID=269670 RepID=A0A1I2QSS8_9BACL|nr:hypothetical protein SAMN02982927_01260 [Sporolactobacillus nakayamae]